MSELELDKHNGFRVGSLVQLIEDDSHSSPEGVLTAIRREVPQSHYRYLVTWGDGSEELLTPAKVKRTGFSDFPHWESDEARAQKWVTDVPHYWIRFHQTGTDGGSCLFCGRMRGIIAAHNLGPCPGLSRIELRRIQLG